jgi:PDZ domain-containing protein
MVTSQQVAQVVAERAIGKRVPIRHGGALVEEVLARSPAARASIRPGDVVVSARGRPVASAQDMVDAMKGVRPGQIVRFGLRGGRIETIRTVPSKDDRRRAIIGVSIGDSVHVGKLPIHVRFSVPGIGGPSAGLAFALEIYDSLTGRQLLRGHKVCVTGELDLAGDVIPIGGAKQKTIGCIDAGADVFLVPAGDNAHDARIAAHGRLRVIAVRSFQGALRVLRALPSARDRG